MTGGSEAPRVSVVVATYGRSGLLPRLLAALEAQEGCGGFEVVIVDDGSRDDSTTVLQRLAATSRLDLRPHRLPVNQGPAVARNVGWREARAPLIAFTDDDCAPQPGWLAALIDGLARHDIVQGTTRPNPAQMANLGPFSHTMEVQGENGFYETCNVGYRREVLERIGGFDERFRYPYGEDADLAWRAKESGATTGFERSALVYHDIRPASFRAHVQDLRRRSGVVMLTNSHPGMRSQLHRRLFFRTSHPPALLAAAGIAIASLRRKPWTLFAGALFTLPYLRHLGREPSISSRSSRLTVAPIALASDLAEVGVLAAASVRTRTLVL